MKNLKKSIFRAYDVRGIYPTEINEQTAYVVGRAYAFVSGAKNVVVGRDMRRASANLMGEIIRGLVDSGCTVTSVGQITNDMISFALFHYKFDGSIILSASHNPIGYGGAKMMKAGNQTIPGNDPALMKAVEKIEYKEGKIPKVKEKDIKGDYLKFVLSFINPENLQKKKILIDPLFGSVGLIVKDALKNLPIDPIYLHETADPNFGGLSEPNPLNVKIRKEAIETAKKEKPDFGVIWDGDGDRAFFIDENGEFINPPFSTAIMIDEIFRTQEAEDLSVVGDIRTIWPIQKACQKHSIPFFESIAGYRFIKEKMKETGATFGAEASGHYYFKKNAYCDNGFIPFLLIWQAISTSQKTLSELVAPYKENYFMVDEMKFELESKEKIDKKLAHLSKIYKNYSQNNLDGLTVEAGEFRLNIRPSNTEPVLRANLESRTKEALTKNREIISENLK